MKLLTTILFALVLSIWAVASEITDEAQDAIRDFIRSETNYTEVNFDRASEAFFSGSESKVSGSGTAYERGQRRGERFTYSIKVHRSSLRSRDGEVKFDNGQSLRGGGGEPSRDRERLDVSISAPSRNQSFRPGNVTVEGSADGRGKVEVRILDRRGREIARATPGIGRNGRWSARFRLNEGDYRAQATREGWRGRSEVNFRVNRDADNRPTDQTGWGRLNVNEPRDRASVNGPKVDVSGTTSDGGVEITIFLGEASVFRGKAIATRGRWSTTVELQPGEYRLLVRNLGSSQTRESTFRVR